MKKQRRSVTAYQARIIVGVDYLTRLRRKYKLAGHACKVTIGSVGSVPLLMYWSLGVRYWFGGENNDDEVAEIFRRLKDPDLRFKDFIPTPYPNEHLVLIEVKSTAPDLAGTVGGTGNSRAMHAGVGNIGLE